ncbi:MAG: hypothetical protein IT371_17040 [Deltaproteobacteria bacterium]|nr:hypothetical protein [Deltaproteobacteria bacterium]
MRSLAPIILLTLLGGLPASAEAYELEFDLGLYNRFSAKVNEVERLLRYDLARAAWDTSGYLNPSRNDLSYGLVASAGVYFAPTKWLGLGLDVDSGLLKPYGRLPATQALTLQRLGSVFGSPEVVTTGDAHPATANERRIRDEARATAFVRQAYVRLLAPKTGWLKVDLGRRRTELADGLIYDDFATGVRLVADFDLLRGLPLRLSAQAVLPNHDFTVGLRSPLVEAKVEWVISMMESLGLLFAYYRDGDDNFSHFFSPLVGEAAVRTAGRLEPAVHGELFAVASTLGGSSRANLFWVGAAGNKLIGDLTLSGTFLVQLGTVRVDNPFAPLASLPVRWPALLPRAERLEIATLGFALDTSARYLLRENLTLSGFFLYLSGEENPFTQGERTSGRYGSFISVVPYLTHTNLFFSGGLNETFSGRQASSSGLNGRGVIAPGAGLDWEITERVAVGTTLAGLFAQEVSPTGGRVYGLEVDLEARWEIASWVKASVEYDVLVPGSFFAQRGVAHKVLVGLDVSYEYER